MAAYLNHKEHSDIPKPELPKLFPLAAPQPKRPWPAEPLPGAPGRTEGRWVFENDKNAATHLIRNNLAGNGDRTVRRMVMSLRDNAARQMRDDMTAV
jgi:hypothetical protein